MTGSKNSIAAKMGARKPILEDTAITVPQTSKKPKPVKGKQKDDREKTTSRVQVFMTEAEFSNLSDRAGDVPLSKFVRKALIAAGVI